MQGLSAYLPIHQPHWGEQGRGLRTALQGWGEGGLGVPVLLWVMPKRKNVLHCHLLADLRFAAQTRLFAMFLLPCICEKQFFAFIFFVRISQRRSLSQQVLLSPSVVCFVRLKPSCLSPLAQQCPAAPILTHPLPLAFLVVGTHRSCATHLPLNLLAQAVAGTAGSRPWLETDQLWGSKVGDDVVPGGFPGLCPAALIPAFVIFLIPSLPVGLGMSVFAKHPQCFEMDTLIKNNIRKSNHNPNLQGLAEREVPGLKLSPPANGHHAAERW